MLTDEGEPAGRAGLFLAGLSSFSEYRAFLKRQLEVLAGHAAVEARLLRENEGEFLAAGFCYVCQHETGFRVDYAYAPAATAGRRIPNWRERLVCPSCGLNNRMRATVHLIELMGGADAHSDIYLTEQTTATYAGFARRFPRCVGSEWLHDGTARGATNARGLRNEDVTALSFDDASFDIVVSLDVFEHVPDFRAAFAECHRVLRPGGRLFVTVPFRIDLEDHLVRARVGAEGRVEHLLEPEYHGDPVNEQGCLAFYHFGWQILDDFREQGFDRARAYLYWSSKFGYLGGTQSMFAAEKGGPATPASRRPRRRRSP